MSLDQFQQIYFEECDELVDNLEQILVNIDLERLTNETINTIFRCIHSIKGGSATFGFAVITSFTHLAENYLDLVRKDQRTLDRSSIDLLLETIDCLRELIDSYKAKQIPDSLISAQLSEKYTHLINNSNQESEQKDIHSGFESEQLKQDKYDWKIIFKPASDILRTGYDPLKILRVLGRMGEVSTKVNIENLEKVEKFNPIECYVSWEIYIETVKTEQEIRNEAFDWVESSSLIEFQNLNQNSSAVNNQAESEQEETEKKIESKSSNESKVKFKANDLTTKPSKESLSIRVHTDKVDSLINMVGELVITQSMLAQIGNNFDDSKIEELKKGLAKLELNCREIQDNIMRIRMLPISNAFNRYKRIVGDLSRSVNKKIELNITGEDTELDKIVLEKIGDPLIHLVRNSIDHGLEGPEQRKASGKSEVGNIFLKAYHQGSNIVIQVGDDGRGIDSAKVLKKAYEKGLIPQSKQLKEEEILELIFMPGFSTADEVTDISGCGVGMDVVKRNIEALNGRIDIKSSPGNGTLFSIILPLTLAILDGQLVRVGQETYVIPIISIKEIIQIESQFINRITENSEVYYLRNEYIPILRTNQLLNIPVENDDLENKFLVVVEDEKNNYGIVINQLLQQQQAVIKSMDNYYKSIDGISGATILADGQVSLILDPGGLVRLTHKQQNLSGMAKAS